MQTKLKQYNYLYSLLLLLFLLVPAQRAKAAPSSDIILILNSYVESARLSGNTVGIVMHEVSQMPYIAFEENMNIFMMDKERMRSFTKNLFEKYRGKNRPDYLILIGNAAFSLREQIKKNWGDIPIILCGEEDFMVPQSYYLSGEAAPADERIPIEQLKKEYNLAFMYNKTFVGESIEMICSLVPDVKKIIYGADSLYVSRQNARAIKKYLEINHPEIDYERLSASRRIEVNEILGKLNREDKTTVLLTGSWLYISTGLVGQPESNTGMYRILSNSTITSFALKESGMIDGGMIGGYVGNQREFEEQLIRNLRQVLSGKRASSIPTYVPTGGPLVNYPIAAYKGINMELCPPDTRFIDKPVSLWKIYRWYILVGAVVLVLFFIFQERRIDALSKLKKAQEKSLKTSKRYNELVNNMPIVYIRERVVLDPIGNPKGVVLLDTNREFVNYFSSSELNGGKNDHGAGRFNSTFLHLLKIVLTEKRSVTFSYYYEAKKSYFEIVMNNTEEDDVVDMFCLDTTELHIAQQKLSSANHKLSMALDIANIVPWKWDLKKKHIICDVNKPAELSEYSIGKMHHEDEQLIISESKYLNRIHKEDRLLVRKLFEELIDGLKDRVEAQYRIVNRSYGGGPQTDWVEVQAAVYERDENGRPTTLIGSSLVISDRKKMENDLLTAKEQAEESNRLKSAFLANMSHEIRTPLNAIVGFSSILANLDDADERQEYVSIIENNNALLLQLINDILDLSKIEADTMDFVYSDIELNNLLKEVYDIIRIKVDESRVELKRVCGEPAPFYFHTEKNRLQQILINFLTNAAKFTKEGSITFGYKFQKEKDMLYFYTTDTGCGIPADKLDSVFGRFVKLNTFAQGTGLGLAICQTIVKKMGGEIGVESEEGKGSTFWCTLPYKPVKKPEEKKKEDIKPIVVSHKKLTILVAEDNEINYKLYKTILGKDYELVHAWNGKEAVRLFKQRNPQLILMDINMPEMNGLEAARAIRKISTTVPILAVTAYAYASDEHKAMSSGFTGFMAKPVKANVLRKEISDILSKRVVLM